MRNQSYFCTPAKPDSGPFGDDALCFLLDLVDDGGNLFLGGSKVGVASEICANGFPLLFCVRWEPSRAGILAPQEVGNEDLILVGAFATIGQEIGTLCLGRQAW